MIQKQQAMINIPFNVKDFYLISFQGVLIELKNHNKEVPHKHIFLINTQKPKLELIAEYTENGYSVLDEVNKITFTKNVIVDYQYIYDNEGNTIETIPIYETINVVFVAIDEDNTIFISQNENIISEQVVPFSLPDLIYCYTIIPIVLSENGLVYRYDKAITYEFGSNNVLANPYISKAVETEIKQNENFKSRAEAIIFTFNELNNLSNENEAILNARLAECRKCSELKDMNMFFSGALKLASETKLIKPKVKDIFKDEIYKTCGKWTCGCSMAKANPTTTNKNVCALNKWKQ